MKIDKRNPRHWLLLAQQAAFSLLVIALRPFSRQPRTPMVVMYGHQLSGNLKALYEEWQRSFTQFFSLHFMSLDPDYGKQLEQQGINVLRCNRLKDMLAIRKAAAMLTDHGLHAMTPLVRFTDIKFIDVWHGIPFKGFVPDDFKLQHQYDEVWVSSPLLKNLYVEKFGFNPNIVFDMGYARADRLFRNDPPNPAFRAVAGIPDKDRIVLYAPTWKQDDQGRELFPFNESQESFIGALSLVCKRHSATLVIRSHLNAHIGKKRFDNVVYCPMAEFPDTESLLLDVDILICDWSSIAFEFLALNRPTIFLDIEPPFKSGFSLGPEYRFGDVVSDMITLNRILNQTMNDESRCISDHQDTYRKVVADVYGNHTMGSTARFQLDRLKNLAKRN